MTAPQDWPVVALPPLPPARGVSRLRLLPGTLARLGLPALLRYARHRLRGAAALPADAPSPAPPFLHDQAGPDPGIDWHGAAPAHRPALAVPTAGPFDIRLLWEPARLVDLPTLPPATAEALVRSFVAANPPFRGSHWACGQEAAIRLAHLLETQAATGRPPHPGFLDLVALHRTRIEATLDYAIAQDNNHAVSEAAGLWAASMRLDDDAGADRGWKLLERAMARLFAASGAFSQHSTRYHALAVEMAAFADRFAIATGGPGLSPEGATRLHLAAAWLAQVTDPASGRAWRVGHDDSSRLFGASRDDFAPALAHAVHQRQGPGPRPAPLPCWLDAEGGFAALGQDGIRVYLRLPVHRFRPSQADALHLELWRGSDCLLGDAGTALYNVNADPTAPDLARTAAHNTIAFDDDDQMPRLSRFLYGAWLRPIELAAEPGRMLGAYRDWRGRYHRREVRLTDAGLAVEDRFDGRFARATLRFRLPEAAWRIEGAAALGPFRLHVAGAAGLRLVRLPFAPHYGTWTTTPALEAWADRPGRLITTITLANSGGSA